MVTEKNGDGESDILVVWETLIKIVQNSTILHSMPANQMAGGCINPSLYLPKSKLHGLSDDNHLKTHSLILKERMLIDDPTAGRRALT